MKNLLIVALAFFSLSAAAAVIGPDQVQGQQQGQGQAQGQIQGQAQGQGQAQFSNADSRSRAHVLRRCPQPLGAKRLGYACSRRFDCE